MTNINPPPKFPQFIFLLSDHETIELACDIATALEALDPELVHWDFLEPIHEAISNFVTVDWGSDLGDPRKHTLGDHIKSLAAWCDDHFGGNYLGLTAFKEAHEGIAIGYDRPIVFRDARWIDIEPFVATFKPHQMLIINLTTVEKPLNEHISSYRYLPNSTVESVVAAIVEASK